MSDAGPLFRRSSANKRYALMLDAPDAPALGAIIGMVDGGGVKGDVVEQRVGGMGRPVKMITNPTFDPVSAQIGAAIAGPVADWIHKSAVGECGRLTGSILRLNFDGEIIHTMNFRDALITELTIPACDPKATDTQSISIKFQPEWAEHVPGGGEKHTGEVPNNQKLFSSRLFRFEIDGIPKFPVTKVEALTYKQDITPLKVGAQTIAQLEPTKLTMPNIVFYVPLVHADDLFAWHKEFVVEGKNSNAGEKTASLTFLSPDRATELIKITFDGVGVISAGISKSQGVGGQPEAQLAKIELYVEAMDIEFPNASVT